jgi:glycerol-3-phosphate O-acyltransferase
MKEYPHIIPNVDEWPIASFYSDRSRVVKKLTNAALDHFNTQTQFDISQLLNQAIYAEKLRSKSNPLKVDPPNDFAYWSKLESDLSSSIANPELADEVQQEIMRKVIHRYSEEIAGNFVPKTFLFARRLLTFFFKLIYNPFYNRGNGLFWGSKDSLLDKFTVIGPMDHIRGLFDKGTVVILPTHFSNLDSILIGYGIEMLTGLPSFSYGAGLNLYDYELMAYFMSRLGAYKVDRRKKNPIYLHTLKQFSTISIQEGLNNIFFPGGTRSRSGALEKELKLGLLSTLVDSQNQFYLRNFDKKIIVVPLVISYHFVLEASGLIEQHLRRTGKENYLSTRGGGKKGIGAFGMLRRVFKSDSNVTLSFGKPIDIFGNPLDEDGNSVKGDRIVDIKEYFKSEGNINYDHQRNMVYTRSLAASLVKSYSEENVVLSSHLVTFTAFEIFRQKNINMDIFSVVSLPADFFNIPHEEFFGQLERVRAKLLELEGEGKIKLSEAVRNKTANELLEEAIKHVNTYHSLAPIKSSKGSILCESLKLLYYYRNRLEGYRLDKAIEVSPVKSYQLSRTLF